MKHFELRNLYGMFLHFKQIQNPEYLSELSTRIIKSQVVAIRMIKLDVFLQDTKLFVLICLAIFLDFCTSGSGLWIRMIKLHVLLQDNISFVPIFEHFVRNFACLGQDDQTQRAPARQ